MRKTLVVCVILFILGNVFASNVNISLKKEIDHSMRNGLKWLEQQQEDNGSWNHYPAITALCMLAILRANPEITSDYEPISKGLKFIDQCAQMDGSIHVGELPNYNTSICLLALKEVGDPKYDETIIKAEQYLMGNQLDEDKGFTSDSLFYGGMGYDGSDNRPDMSNLNWVSEALVKQKKREEDIESKEQKDVNAEEKKLFFDKALTFLSRCQNLKEYNPESYSANDGGFIYEVGKSKIGGTRSYGTMTYVGLKTMIYAQLKKDDPRIAAAYEWLQANYRVDETAKMGNQGLFYYWLTMARSLSVWGETIFTDSDGVEHNWREELASEIIKAQNNEGWWQNENGRWWENNPVLVTAYSLLAFEEILENK